MSSPARKGNIADGLFEVPAFSKAPSLSPRKSSRKTRSKSIGPGGLEAPEQPVLKETTGNRRKSAFIPAVKSILASNEDEKKKRRKSLARRRVSFAPEATLHTWDVVEYLRDATTSSASSEASRRASNISEATNHTSFAPEIDDDARPATPPEKMDEFEPEMGSSPANQRDLHQKKNRRSSGIPPMNFNNPDDDYSSSEEGEDAGPELEEETVKFGGAGHAHESDSFRLDEALRQATAHAGNHRRSLEEEEGSDSDVSMDLAEDEVTVAFKPWAKKSFDAPVEEDEDAEGDDEDMSMDITRAIGGIVQKADSSDSGSDMDMDDMSMDLTVPIGKIKAAQEQSNRRKSLKRRASVLQPSQDSPAKSRRTSLRNRASLGGGSPSQEATMDFTVAIGSIKPGPALQKQQSPSRRNSVETSIGEETMDFTVAMGSIKKARNDDAEDLESDAGEDEDLSMEFTNVLGGIKNLAGIRNLNKPLPEPVVAKQSPQRTPSPKKSPAPAEGEVKYPDLSIPKEKASTPQKSPIRPRGLETTPQIPPPSGQIEQFEQSPFVRRSPQGSKLHLQATTTPPSKASPQRTPIIPEDPITAPILNRRRSSLSQVQFSPLAAVKEEPVLKSTAKLSDSIKLLSTPRKQTLMSPMKHGPTPKNTESPLKAPTPKQKTATPKKASPLKRVSPQKRVAFGAESPAPLPKVEVAISEPQDDVERISLQDFLDITKIRFMELSTTKRRHTAAPSSFHNHDIEEKEDTLDSYVVAGASTLPEYEMYQHACHELKRYISDGRHFVRSLEGSVLEENPLLFTEYLTAPPDQRAVMDNQFKNLKTNARLNARGVWYTWRSTLLENLKTGLLNTMNGFTRDESTLAEREKILDAVVPALVEKHVELQEQHQQLQQRHDELNSCDREELEETREQLVTTVTDIAEKKRLLAQLQQELADKESRIQAAKERKTECMGEIKAAERVREECRGWSTREVAELRDRVAALEKAHGWSITTCTSKTITMTHLSDLELFFHPSAFVTGAATPNASISLTYVGDSAAPHPRPLTTSKRFFLQLIRAHLHCIPQCRTPIASLLNLVAKAWASALAVAEGVRWLQHSFITDETILSDERMVICANLVLPSLQTKVRCTFEVSVGIGEDGDGVQTSVEPGAELVYGEKYKVERMKAFLRDFCGTRLKGEGEGSGNEMMVWADGVLDLAGRLRATGRKGERA